VAGTVRSGMVPDFDACVVPVGVEVLGIEDLAA
jgi:hypothetical protein